MRLSSAFLTIAVLIAAPRQAWAFETAPWDARAFGARATMGAASQARVATALAIGQARAGQGGRTRASGATNFGMSGCTVNVGGVTLSPLGNGPSSLSVTANTVVNGDVITVCR